MYFNKKNKFFHGIMFHHFHDDKMHIKSQGSINSDDFYKIIKFIGKNNILDADVYFEKFKNNKLKNNQVCLTFDDAIKSQIDIALPILEDLNIKGFFFVYTSLFEGNPDSLEIFRYFRAKYFNSVDKFYQKFYEILNLDLVNFFKQKNEIIKETKSKFPFYTIEDIKFRLVRDHLLSKTEYEKTIFYMIKQKKINYKEFYKKLFFQKIDLQNVNNLGHLVGLHSHNHPTLLEKLNYDEQKDEYEKCLSIISKILNKPKNQIKTMSHPCGSYNDDTLEILKELGIELGFKQIMKLEKVKKMKKINNSPLEIAREDHSSILKRINK